MFKVTQLKVAMPTSGHCLTGSPGWGQSEIWSLEGAMPLEQVQSSRSYLGRGVTVGS